MKKSGKKAIVISISSDIGVALSEDWIAKGWEVFGTYRTRSADMNALSDKGAHLIPCDLSSHEDIDKACQALHEVCDSWDVLIFCTGTQEPIGLFPSVDFDQWAKALDVNFMNQLKILHKLLPKRNLSSSLEPMALFFAGGGTNNATLNYSAYTISKISLIKMCELLDAEIKDTRFSIVGPGWVKTKIHEQTLKAGERSGDNYARAKEKLASDECTPMSEVVGCCNWVIEAHRSVVSGRNISVVYDKWGTDALAQKLSEDPNMYKLRRSGNAILARELA